MPAYEICYLDDDGALACTFSVQFDSPMRAKILAHAMKPQGCHRIEIWQGKALVYQRPEAGELDDALVLAHTRLYEPSNIANPA